MNKVSSVGTPTASITDPASGLGSEQPIANPTLLPYANPGYRPPTPEEIRVVMRLLGTTAEQLALLVGVKDGRAVRRWLSPATAKTHAQIDYAIWRLMLLEAGLIEPPKSLIETKSIRSKRPILNLKDEQSEP